MKDARDRLTREKYPHLPPEQILSDLIASTPGEEGKWFATAKTLGFFELAAALARQSPVDIATLNRAARDYLEKNPPSLWKPPSPPCTGLPPGSLRNTGADVHDAVRYACESAAKEEKQEEVLRWISAWAHAEATDEFVRQQMKRALGIFLR